MTYYRSTDCDMLIDYRNYTNIDAGFRRGYQPGDRLTVGWHGAIDEIPDGGTADTLERIFAIHNRDTRPDGQMCPSMSVGDVIVLDDGSAWSCEPAGWVTVELNHNDILDSAWIDTI